MSRTLPYRITDVDSIQEGWRVEFLMREVCDFLLDTCRVTEVRKMPSRVVDLLGDDRAVSDAKAKVFRRMARQRFPGKCAAPREIGLGTRDISVIQKEVREPQPETNKSRWSVPQRANDSRSGDFVDVRGANKIAARGILQSALNAISLESFSIPGATLFDVVRDDDVPNLRGELSNLFPLRAQAQLLWLSAECSRRLNDDEDVDVFVQLVQSQKQNFDFAVVQDAVKYSHFDLHPTLRQSRIDGMGLASICSTKPDSSR